MTISEHSVIVYGEVATHLGNVLAPNNKVKSQTKTHRTSAERPEVGSSDTFQSDWSLEFGD